MVVPARRPRSPGPSRVGVAEASQPVHLCGARRRRWRLLGAFGIAVGAYVILYAVTTWLGGLA